jgi:cold shock CspA family protein
MAVGKVVRFDERRGFGFIAPLGGREDVFLHVNDLLIPESLVRPGAMLEFDIDEGERGYKASNISLPENAKLEAPARAAAAIAAAPARAVTTAPEGTAPTPLTVAAASDPLTLAPASDPSAAQDDGGEFCDLLTMNEFSSQVTELLLTVVPALTGEQVLNIRSQLAEFARNSGWLMR